MRSIKAFTITEARSQLFQLLKMVDEGDEIVIVNSKDHHKFQITHANLSLPLIVTRYNGESLSLNEKQKLQTSKSEKQQSDEPSTYDVEPYEKIRKSSEHAKEYAKQYYIRKQLGEL
jgi:hypothetical protein